MALTALIISVIVLGLIMYALYQIGQFRSDVNGYEKELRKILDRVSTLEMDATEFVESKQLAKEVIDLQNKIPDISSFVKTKDYNMFTQNTIGILSGMNIHLNRVEDFLSYKHGTNWVNMQGSKTVTMNGMTRKIQEEHLSYSDIINIIYGDGKKDYTVTYSSKSQGGNLVYDDNPIMVEDGMTINAVDTSGA